MQLTRTLHRAASGAQGLVATLGGFDGIHIGHQALVARACLLAKAASLRSMMVTFEPLPREFLMPEDPPSRLTSFRERWRLLSASGLDAFCMLRFSSRLQQQEGEEFARMLVAAGVRQMVIGHDFRAGRGRAASAQWFKDEGPRLGLAVDVLEPVLLAGNRVSSRAVRDALQAGQLDSAAAMLGRRYSMRGRVIHGQQLGRTLGYPTANLRLARRRAPMNGIFAVRVRGEGLGAAALQMSGGLPAVASLGTRPTVGGQVPLLEVHLFDFKGDLYGREIEVEFVARLRDELKFANVDAMVVQMNRDADEARSVLRNLSLN
jgi:riboflavin kinase/FMN adenylyltransferase